MNPRFHRDLAVPLGAAPAVVEEREVLELLDMLASEGVTIRPDALVVEGLTRHPKPHVACAVEVLDGRERAVRRVLENVALFTPAAVADRAKRHVEAARTAGKLEKARPPRRRRSPDGSFAKADPE